MAGRVLPLIATTTNNHSHPISYKGGSGKATRFCVRVPSVGHGVNGGFCKSPPVEGLGGKG